MLSSGQVKGEGVTGKSGEEDARKEADGFSWSGAKQSVCTCALGPERGGASLRPAGLSASMAFITEGDPFNGLSAPGSA